MKPLINKKIKPACEYCSHGSMTPDGTEVLCEKHGILLPDSHCRSFRYDILKRQPKKPLLPDTDFTEEDFRL